MVYSSFIPNSQNLEATKMSSLVGEWKNKLVYSDNEILSALKRNNMNRHRGNLTA